MIFYLAGRDDFCFVSGGWHAKFQPSFIWVVTKGCAESKIFGDRFSHPLFGWLLRKLNLSTIILEIWNIPTIQKLSVTESLAYHRYSGLNVNMIRE